MDKRFLLLIVLLIMYLVVSFVIKVWTGYIIPKAEEAADQGLIAVIGFVGCLAVGMYIGYKIVTRNKKK